MKYLKQLFTPYKGLPKEVYVIFVARIINALGCFVMPLMTIILKDSIGLSDQLTGVYISAAGLLFLPASMIGGKLADTIGRKKVIILFDSMAAVLYISCSFMIPSMKMIYVIMAAAACLVTAGPAHDSLMADITTPQNRESAYALSYMGWNLGFAIGPFVGGMLYEKYLPLVFLGDAVTALLSLSLVVLFIKETIHKTEEEITDESRVLEKREQGSIFSVLIKRPVLIYFALIIFGFNFVYSQWSFLIPIHMLEKFPAHKAEYYGSLASFNGLIVILFTPLITYYFQKSKSIRRMVYGGFLYAIGFGMLGLFNGLVHFFISAFIFTLGEILLAISTAPFIANHTPASHRGRMSAVIPMIFGMGQTLGPIGMGQILTYTGIEPAWLLMGGIGMIFTILMFILEQKEEKKQLGVLENQGV
ncbi:MAG: transporter [Anaerosolibacter sp.]|jgi:MFS family permease|uniref:MFS transporter n=1 Tax=Anaerosolibacter sp. TaxID=1872527 RepID=UPI0026077141|nr:MFS transporter [Anaerosolibacter sp.]MDF2545256.1 transporter [Anaerosolibacter sp.]